MLNKNILGLSHFLCETSEEYDWTLTLGVPEEKKKILHNQQADSVSLYLTSWMGYPVELIKHRPQGALPPKPPKLTLDKEIVLVRVPDTQSAGELLATLGFKQTGESWLLKRPIFRPLMLQLVEDKKESDAPKVDDQGLTGITLLVKDLDKVAEFVPLISHQRLVLEGVHKEIAFFSGSGLLLEFLMVMR